MEENTMEEKKLTDEEMIKALEMHACNGRKYSFEEWDRCKTVTQSDILDIIHRLQSENAEQKAEIERLTETLAMYILKAWFYYKKCKEYGIECVIDEDLESQFKPAKEGKMIQFPKFEWVEVE